jgi:hypothetical protein
MATTICTFNVNNLFARYRFWKTFPGDRAKVSLTGDPGTGYLPAYDPDYIWIFNEKQRDLERLCITRDNAGFPDILVLVEVESLIALRRFNELYLDGVYPYAMLVDSRDFRQIDVAILSKKPLLGFRSHIDDPDPEGGKDHPYLFSRDCLEVDVALQDGTGRRLTLFINHLKSKYSESDEQTVESDDIRGRQARAVCDIVRKRFYGSEFDSALFAVVGDMNDVPWSAPLKPLLADCGLVNAVERIGNPDDRWTYWYRGENTVSQIDYLLLSPALDEATEGMVPHIERRGIGFREILKDGLPGPKMTGLLETGSSDPRKIPFRFGRFPGVTGKVCASDHCPVFLDIP